MDWMSPAILVMVCLVLSAFFSGSETALLRLGSHEIDEEVRALRGPAAIAVRDLLKSTSRLLVTILLGTAPIGFGISCWILLPLQLLALWAIARFIGRPVDVDAAR